MLEFCFLVWFTQSLQVWPGDLCWPLVQARHRLHQRSAQILFCFRPEQQKTRLRGKLEVLDSAHGAAVKRQNGFIGIQSRKFCGSLELCLEEGCWVFTHAWIVLCFWSFNDKNCHDWIRQILWNLEPLQGFHFCLAVTVKQQFSLWFCWRGAFSCRLCSTATF